MSCDSNPFAPPTEDSAKTRNAEGVLDRLAQRVIGGLLAGILGGGLASFSVVAIWIFSAGLPPSDELLYLPAVMLYLGLLCVIYDAGCILALTVCATLAGIVTLVKGHLGVIVLASLAGIAGYIMLGLSDTDEIFPKPLFSYGSRVMGTAAAGYAAAYVARLRSP